MSAGKVLVVDTPAGVVKSAARGDAGRRVHRLPGRGAAKKPGPPTPAAAAQRVPVEAGAAAEPRLPLQAGTSSWFSLQRMLSLQLPRADGADPRPDPHDDGRPGQRDPDDHHGLRHHPGRGAPELRRAGPRPDDRQPRLPDQHCRLEPLLHRAAADRRLRGARPAHAVGRGQHGHRDPPRLRPRRGARWSGGEQAGARSASGSTAPCRSAPRRSGATCRACTCSG